MKDVEVEVKEGKLQIKVKKEIQKQVQDKLLDKLKGLVPSVKKYSFKVEKEKSLIRWFVNY